MNIAGIVLTGSALAALAVAAEKKVTIESLPAAVQAAVKAQTRNATVLGISAENENGRLEYEVETTVNGKSRDLTFDSKGTVLEIEDETDLDSVPAAAKATLQKRAGTGTIRKVEKVTAGSKISYEATIRSKAGKSSEVGVNADGSLKKGDD